VRGGLALVDLLAAVALREVLAAPRALVAADRHAGRGGTLVLSVALLCFVAVRRARVVLGVVGLIHVAVVRSRAVDRDRHVDVGLFALRLAFGRLRGRVAVRRGLALVDLRIAVALAGATAVVARDAGGDSALVLLVFLLCAVVVRRGCVVLGAVGLVYVAVVRVRAIDRNRH